MHRLLILLISALPMLAQATAYELVYKEEEPGIEAYISRTVVTDRYLRIDDLSDESGYILYDDKDKTVYSVSHLNSTILVIKRQAFESPAISTSLVTTDEPLKDAPKIAGKTVNDFRGARHGCHPGDVYPHTVRTRSADECRQVVARLPADDGGEPCAYTRPGADGIPDPLHVE